MTKKEAIKTLRELWRETNDSWYENVYDMAIEALQTDLVQCKDCKHRETDDCPMYWVEWSIFEDCDGYTDDKYIVHDYTTDDGFCNYGERKES